MAKQESPANKLLRLFLSAAVMPPLKAGGFRKSSTNFHRRNGEAVQVVNIQSSRGNSWNEVEFFLNVGIAFDRMCRHYGKSILETPKEYECDSRGTRDRIRSFLPNAPTAIRLQVGGDHSATESDLKAVMVDLVRELDDIDGLIAYRTHRWFDRFRPRDERAQILYLLDDLDGAWAEVKALAAFFHDRMNANRVEWWIDHLSLERLRDRLQSNSSG